MKGKMILYATNYSVKSLGSNFLPSKFIAELKAWRAESKAWRLNSEEWQSIVKEISVTGANLVRRSLYGAACGLLLLWGTGVYYYFVMDGSKKDVKDDDGKDDDGKDDANGDGSGGRHYVPLGGRHYFPLGGGSVHRLFLRGGGDISRDPIKQREWLQARAEIKEIDAYSKFESILPPELRRCRSLPQARQARKNEGFVDFAMKVMKKYTE